MRHSMQKERPIFYKLNAAIEKGVGDIEIQVSEEELEMMIDNIGPLTAEDSEARKGLRTKLQNFLAKLKE